MSSRLAPLCHQVDQSGNGRTGGGSSRCTRAPSDPRLAVLRPADWLPMLLDVYGAAAGTAVRHVCLRATLRCVSAAEPDALKVGTCCRQYPDDSPVTTGCSDSY